MTPKGAKDNPRKFGPGLAAFQPLHVTEVVTSQPILVCFSVLFIKQSEEK